MNSLSSSLSSASSTYSSSFSQEALCDGDPCKMDGTRPVLPRKKAYGNPYPRRGQIKAKIFRAVVKCIIAMASELGKGRRRKKGDPGDAFTTNPAPSPPPLPWATCPAPPAPPRRPPPNGPAPPCPPSLCLCTIRPPPAGPAPHCLPSLRLCTTRPATPFPLP